MGNRECVIAGDRERTEPLWALPQSGKNLLSSSADSVLVQTPFAKACLRNQFSSLLEMQVLGSHEFGILV